MRNIRKTDKTGKSHGMPVFLGIAILTILSPVVIIPSVFSDRTGTTNQAMMTSMSATALHIPVVTTTMLTRNTMLNNRMTDVNRNLSRIARIECNARMQALDNSTAVPVRTSLPPRNPHEIEKARQNPEILKATCMRGPNPAPDQIAGRIE